MRWRALRLCKGSIRIACKRGGGRYVRIYGNTFTNVADSNIDYDAIGQGVIQDVYIYNNLFHITKTIDDYPDFIRMYSTGLPVNTESNVKILHNTFLVDAGQLSSSVGQIMGFGFGNGSGAGTGASSRTLLNFGGG